MNLYHGTTNKNLSVLTPHMSSHGESYVYATDSKVFATWNIGNDPYKRDKWVQTGSYNKKFYIREMQPNAFNLAFKNVSGVIYIVDDTNFELLTGNCVHGHEYVSKQEVPIKNKIYIRDSLKELLKYGLKKKNYSYIGMEKKYLGKQRGESICF